jgi:hypothetical protein
MRRSVIASSLATSQSSTGPGARHDEGVFKQAQQMCDVMAAPDRIITPLRLDAAHPRQIALGALLQESPNP